MGTEHSHVYAALDLGSNSFHLLVAQVAAQHWQVQDKLKHMVRLAEGVRSDGSLDAAVRERALHSLRLMRQRLDGISDENIRVVGTKALRSIRADDPFLTQAEDILGVPVEIVSGREEARLLYHGVRHSLPPLKKHRLVMDIGGGSTELIVGQGETILQRESLGMGCVTFTRRFFQQNDERKAFRQAWEAATLEARLVLRPYLQTIQKSGWHQAVGASGTFRAVARVLAATGWGETDAIEAEGLTRLVAHVRAGDPAGVRELPGLSRRRAPVFAAGLAIVAALFDSLGLRRVELARGALREGVILDLSGRASHHDIRAGSVNALASRFAVDAAQVRRVQTVVNGLLHRAAPDFTLKKRHRLALEWAIQLHEVGLAVAHSSFNRHGAYLVAHADLPGFSRIEQNWLAFLVRAQKGKLGDEHACPPVAGKTKWAVQLPLLRCALAVCRSRLDNGEAFLQAVQQVCWREADKTLQVSVDASWLQANPLIAADLKKTARQLEAQNQTGKLALTAARPPAE